MKHRIDWSRNSDSGGVVLCCIAELHSARCWERLTDQIAGSSDALPNTMRRYGRLKSALQPRIRSALKRYLAGRIGYAEREIYREAPTTIRRARCRALRQHRTSNIEHPTSNVESIASSRHGAANL